MVTSMSRRFCQKLLGLLSRTKDTFFAERYGRLAYRKGAKKALIAVGHSILTSVYHVLSTGDPYKELGTRYVPEKIATKRKKYLKEELQKLGYEVVLTKKDANSPQDITGTSANTGRFLLEHYESEYETGPTAKRQCL